MMTPSSAPPMLSRLNFVNAAAFVLNVVVTYGSQLDWFGPSNTVLSDKYQTLITPAGWAFSIWGLIFLGEGVFCVAQLLPAYRRSAAVMEGVGYWWAAACIAQCAWTPLFAQEVMWAQLIAMLSILVCLGGLVRSCASLAARDGLSTREYWLLVAPFSLHLGWIVAASAVSVNVTVVRYCAGTAASVAARDCASTLLASAVVSLGAVLVVAVEAATHAFERPNGFVPGVAAWALLGVSVELASPRASIVNGYGAVVTSAIRGAALVLAATTAALCVLAVALRCSDRRGTRAHEAAPVGRAKNAQH